MEFKLIHMLQKMSKFPQSGINLAKFCVERYDLNVFNLSGEEMLLYENNVPYTRHLISLFTACYNNAIS